jgi:DNA-3-methyladenine glycosylase II
MPPSPSRSWPAAAAALAERDEVMARLVAAVGPPRLRARRSTPFEALARAIVFQQLSGAAAGTIWGRVESLLGSPVTPSAVLSASVESLRGAGLSGAKTLSLLDLAEKVASGAVPLDRRLSRLPDEELIARLVVVRGIGRWTAEMFLMFQLRRLDVWPVDDLGVRKGYGLMYGLPAMPSSKELVALGDPFRPYRSVAAWYCWRAAEMRELPG